MDNDDTKKDANVFIAVGSPPYQIDIQPTILKVSFVLIPKKILRDKQRFS